jgi:DNA-binding CsgD family transcriptional regulator
MLKYTKDMPRFLKIPKELELQIRERVKSGKTKTDVAKELDISYKTVRRYTKDIPTVLRIPVELEHQIRKKVKKRKTRQQVADELNISLTTVRKYTKDIIKKHNLMEKTSPALVAEIKANVIKYNSKIETAKKMGIPYKSVLWHTRDIVLIKGISPELKKKIRRDIIKNGKSKIDVAREYNFKPGAVYNITKDIITGKKRSSEKISGLPLELLKELMQKGYAFSLNKYRIKDSRRLKKYFPNVCRVSLYGKIIYFLREHKDDAMRAFLEAVNLKVIKYNKLKQIIDVFDVEIKRKDKKKLYRIPS